MLPTFAAALVIVDRGDLVAARSDARASFARAGASPGRAVVCRKEGSSILYNYSGVFSWYLFGPDNRLQYDIAGTRERQLGLHRRYLRQRRGARQPAPLSQRHARRADERYPTHRPQRSCAGHRRSGIADPFNGHTDEFRIAHVQRSHGWNATTWNNMSAPGAFAAAAAEKQQGGEPPPLAGAGVMVCLMG